MAYRYHQPLSRYITLQLSESNSHKRQNACYRNLKSNFEYLLQHDCYAIEPRADQAARKFPQPATEDKGADMKEVQAHQCNHKNSEPGSCAV